MQENKKLKIKLTTMVITAILLILIGIVLMVILNQNKQTKNNVENEVEPSISENKINEPVIKEEGYIDMNFKFLTMENNKQNTIYSPLSIKYALKMLGEGAKGNTKLQIDNVIGNLNLTKYENIDKALSLANGIYIKDSYSEQIKDEYKNKLIQKYNAEIKYDAFKNANNVNKWIEDKTLGIIKNMLQDEIMQNPDMRMLIINALAIDMEWQNQFDTSSTYGIEFYLEDGTTMTATTMNEETSNGSISYYKGREATALAMDLKKYDDTQLEFIAIMPEENLSKYIKTFTMDNLKTITNSLIPASKTPGGVAISIPKFSFDYNLKLKEDLIKLGITDAFNKDLADFSDMSQEKLFVGDALHKANIDFTEKGVKAAAVTVFMMMSATAIQDRVQPEVVKIDKPFLFVIKDKETDEIWFTGTVYNPNSWEKDKADYAYKY